MAAGSRERQHTDDLQRRCSTARRGSPPVPRPSPRPRRSVEQELLVSEVVAQGPPVEPSVRNELGSPKSARTRYDMTSSPCGQASPCAGRRPHRHADGHHDACPIRRDPLPPVLLFPRFRTDLELRVCPTAVATAAAGMKGARLGGEARREDDGRRYTRSPWASSTKAPPQARPSSSSSSRSCPKSPPSSPRWRRSDECARAMTDEFRGRLAQCDTKEERVEMLDDMLPEAFAAVRRQPTRSDSATSTSRSWVARPHFGWVAEMKTGEQGPRRHPASP